MRLVCNGEGAPTVMTPVVAAQPDGVHIVVEADGGVRYVLFREPERPQWGWSSGSNGLGAEFTLPIPPGELVAHCSDGTPWPHPAGYPVLAGESSVRVVDPDASWVSTDLVCGPLEDSWSFEHTSSGDPGCTEPDAVGSCSGLGPRHPPQRCRRAGGVPTRPIRRKRVAVALRDPDRLDLGPALQLVGEGVGEGMDRRDDRDVTLEEGRDGAPERARGQLHLPQFVDHHYPLRSSDGRQRDALERREVDPVLPDARWPGQVDVSETGALPLHILDPEADPSAALADLLGGESRHRIASGAKKAHQASGHRGLAAPRTPFEQDLGRAHDRRRIVPSG